MNFTHSCTDLYEARAILLGRLGRHDQALQTYVYRLQDYMKAEEYVHSLSYLSIRSDPHKALQTFLPGGFKDK